LLTDDLQMDILSITCVGTLFTVPHTKKGQEIVLYQGEKSKTVPTSVQLIGKYTIFKPHQLYLHITHTDCVR